MHVAEEEDMKGGIVLHSFINNNNNFNNNNNNNNFNNNDSIFNDSDEEAEKDIKSLVTGEIKEVEDAITPNIKLFLCVAWVTFLGEMSRGVIVPVLWPYLQLLNGTMEFLGFVSSGFSMARFFAAPFFGWLSNKRSHREVMLICLVLLVVGNLMYALYPPPWLLLISRIIVGIGAGTLGQSRGYVSQVTTKSQRTRFMAYLTVSQFAGFAVTPGITSLLSFVDIDIFGVEELEADKYSSAGYLMAVLSFVTIFIIFFIFKDPPKQVVVDDIAPKVKSNIWDSITSFIKSIPQKLKHPEFKKIFLFAALIFVTRTAVAVVETSGSQLTIAFNWNSQKLSYCLCAMGVLGTIILVSLPDICKKLGNYGEGLLLSIGVFSLAFGMALMIPNSIYTFVTGLFFTWAIGSALCQTLIITFLSRVLNPNSQGAVMGGLASLGSVSRIIGSMWIGATLGTTGPLVALGVPAALMVPCLFGVIVLVVQTIRASNRNSSSV